MVMSDEVAVYGEGIGVVEQCHLFTFADVLVCDIFLSSATVLLQLLISGSSTSGWDFLPHRSIFHMN